MIPKQLQKFKHLKVAIKEKKAIEKGWPTYDFNSKELQEHLKNGGNYGILCGQDGLTVIDADMPMVQEVINKELPKTFRVSTSKEGCFHNYFICKDLDKKIVLDDTDTGHYGEVQFKGQYVVGAGSTHPSGKKYEVVEDVPIAKITKKQLLEVLQPFLKKDVKKIFSKYEDNLQRDDECQQIKEKHSLTSLMGEYGYDLSKNPTMCKLGHKSVGEQCFSYDEFKGLWFCFHCGKGGDIFNFVMEHAGIDFTAAKKWFTDYKETKQIVEKGELNVVSLRQMLDSPIPEIEWRVHNVVPKQGITFLAGTAGSMKSFCAMQMAIACATGTPWLEQYDTEKGNVLYIDEENGNVTVPSRFNKLVNGHKLKDELFDNLQISIFNNIVLDSETYMLKILIEKYKPQLVIIDSMVRCMEGEEDKSSDVKKVFQNLKEFMEQGISFVLIHHTTKRETYNMEGLRGSGDFAAFADSVLMFKPGREGYCNVRSVKNRHIAIEELNEFYFQLENETDDSIKLQWKGLKDEQGDIIERCIEEIKEWIANEKISRFTTAQARKEVKDKGFSDNTMYSALKQLTEAKLVTKLKKGNYLTNQDTLVEEEVTD